MDNEVGSKQNRGAAFKRVVIENYVKILLFLLLSGGVVMANFWFENDDGANGVAANGVFYGFSDLSKDVLVPDNGVIRFVSGEGIPENQISVVSADNKAKDYVFDFGGGKFWGNFEYSNAAVNFVVGGKVVVIPDRARFALEFDGNRIKVEVFDGDVYFGFLANGVVFNDYLHPLDERFVNLFLVPVDSQAVIPLSRVGQNLATLFNSKLVKEFGYAGISNEARNTPWVMTNLLKDEHYAELLRQRADLYVVRSDDDGFVGALGGWLAEKLTFVENKKIQQQYALTFDHLMRAVEYADRGDEVSVDRSFNNFLVAINALPGELRSSADFDLMMKEYFDLLALFGPDHRRHVVFAKLVASGVVNIETRVMIGYMWREVYRSVPMGEAVTGEALVRYYENLKQVLARAASRNNLGDQQYLILQNQLWDNLFLRDPLFFKENAPTFYRKKYFDLKLDFEKKLLEVFDDPLVLTELKQSMIDVKIRTLKLLRNFFFAEKVSISDAREIIRLQFLEIDRLLSETVSGGNQAIVDLFEAEISDIDDFWGYLNNPRYHSRSFGETHAERYQAYLSERDSILSIVTIREDITGVTQIDASVEEVVIEIEERFRTQRQLTVINVGEIEVVNQRFVEVNGVIGGYAFKATYDRDQDKLRNVVVFNNIVIAGDGVSLGNRVLGLEVLLDSIISTFVERNGVDEQTEGDVAREETFAQRAARIYIADRLTALGFVASIDSVTMVDSMMSVYRVTGISLQGAPNTLYAFDFVVSGEVVSNLQVSERGGGAVRTFDRTFVLDDLRELSLGVSR